MKRMACSHPFLMLGLWLVACFPASAASEFNRTVQHAYQEALKLRIENSRAIIHTELSRNPQNACALLVENYSDFLTLVFTQDVSRYEALIENQEKRYSKLSALKEQSPYLKYAQGEVKLHLGISKFMFGSQWQAAWDIRQAFFLFQENTKQYPAFAPNKKSYGMLQILLGSVPENYKWVLSIFGLQSSVKEGLDNMRTAAETRHPFQLESQILVAITKEMLSKEESSSLAFFKNLNRENPDNLLFAFLSLSMHKRLKMSEEALTTYLKRPQGQAYLSVPYLHHMAADLYLYRGDYDRSERENLEFLQSYKGRHYIKDAFFKLYLASLLNSEPNQAAAYFKKIGANGTALIEEDKYAQQFYEQQEVVHPLLLQARFKADGGYYQDALQTLNRISPSTPLSLKEKIEVNYRKGRIYHGLGELQEAVEWYKETINTAGKAPYYFAPNAALQLGYIYLDANHKETAKVWFNKALSYPKHEYKNSIDSKAKMALSSL